MKEKHANLLNRDIVKLLDGVLDLVLVGTKVNHEDQRVSVLNALHRRLIGQRVLDDVESIKLRPRRSRQARESEENRVENYLSGELIVRVE